MHYFAPKKNYTMFHLEYKLQIICYVQCSVWNKNNIYS